MKEQGTLNSVIFFKHMHSQPGQHRKNRERGEKGASPLTANFPPQRLEKLAAARKVSRGQEKLAAAKKS